MVVDGSCFMWVSKKVHVGSERTVAVIATQLELSVPVLLKSQGL